jgi:putative FmdB family regulatory protein
MPTYNYRCDSCDHELEAFHKMSDDPLKKCPECGKNKLVRVPSGGIGLAFKGSGFYINDYGPNSGGDSKPESPSSAPAATACCPCGKNTKCSS